MSTAIETQRHFENKQRGYRMVTVVGATNPTSFTSQRVQIVNLSSNQQVLEIQTQSERMIAYSENDTTYVNRISDNSSEISTFERGGWGMANRTFSPAEIIANFEGANYTIENTTEGEGVTKIVYRENTPPVTISSRYEQISTFDSYMIVGGSGELYEYHFEINGTTQQGMSRTYLFHTSVTYTNTSVQKPEWAN